MPAPFSATPEGRFLDEAIGVIKSLNARTNLLIHEYEQIKKATEREHLDHATEPLANEPAGAVKAGR